MTEPLVRQARDGDVAIVTLNRPARHNALVPELLTALLAALDDVAAGDAAALVLASEGRSFSTGGDLRGFLEHRESIGAYADLLVGLLNDVILALYRLPFPTVCAVSGQVCGGSLGLLLACDRVVMQQDAELLGHPEPVLELQAGGLGVGQPGELLHERVQVVGDALIVGQVVGELRQDAAGQRDVLRLDVDSAAPGISPDNREQGVRGQRRRFIGLRPDNLRCAHLSSFAPVGVPTASQLCGLACLARVVSHAATQIAPP